jgi:putative phosphoesterase
VRVGIISDIHCNVGTMSRALEAMGEVDMVLCAGDVVYEYRFSNEAFDIIRERGILTVLGNHERVILSPHGERLRRSGAIDAENLSFLRSLPTTLEMNIDGKRLFMTHGSPWEPLNEYLFPGSVNFNRLPELGADFVILGHTHYPVIARVKEVLVVNPGCCDEAGDYGHRFGPTYALLDTESGEAEIRPIVTPERDGDG